MQMKQSLLVSTVCTIVFLCLSTGAVADVHPHALFSNNMVLQQGISVPVWGSADDGENVTVRFRGQAVSTTATGGTWLVRLAPMKAGGSDEMVITGKNEIRIQNVLVGEVWVCSGQSNMQWPVKQAADSDAEIAAADHPQIRLFTVPRRIAAAPQTEVEATWKVCHPNTVPDFSAVAYFFGVELHQRLHVPIGLIHTSWGGTPAEAWTSRPTLEAKPELKAILTYWEQLLKQNRRRMASYVEQVRQWITDAETAEAAGAPLPGQPNWPRDARLNPHRPSGLFNAMLHPLMPYGIAGAIWYQGESNAGRAFQYRTLFPAMIQDWREAWGQGTFPFLFVQLANFRDRTPDPVDSDWAELREAQLMALSLPKTGMAVTIDIGEADNIHPRNKQDVGKRLALAALAKAYKRDIAYSGPMYHSMKLEDGAIRVTFQHLNGGLVIKGNGVLKGFAIAGKDAKFVWANAAIDGDTVVISSPDVPKPVAVRYGWANNPDCNLYNKAGLPASPFRTDDFPMVTAKQEH